MRCQELLQSKDWSLCLVTTVCSGNDSVLKVRACLQSSLASYDRLDFAANTFRRGIPGQETFLTRWREWFEWCTDLTQDTKSCVADVEEE